MRPYLAVIKDSFREAFATRVLWLVLVLITLLLLALAPLGYDTTQAVSLQLSDFRDPRQFVTQIASQSDNESTPSGYVWSQLSEKLKKNIGEITEETPLRQRRVTFERVRGELNETLQRHDFYNEEVWKEITLNDEAKQLKKRGIDQLSDDDVARLNRLAFDAAFHKHVVAVPAESTSLCYLAWDFNQPWTVEQLQDVVRTTLLELVKYLVGVVGVFAAIVITAWIVPRMLDAGAIDLLLSKPVSRSLLFLSKFFGGCAFIFLSTTYLIVGMWLIAGLRFGVWSSGLLWVIPVFVFVFAIYYSVSTLAAVIWRNAIVSIVVSNLFWSACFSVGLGYVLTDALLNERRTATIIPTGESLLITNQHGSGFEWDAEFQTWIPIFEQPGGGGLAAIAVPYPFSGPYYDSANDRLVALRVPPTRRFRWGSSKLVMAKRKDGWDLQESVAVPSGTRSLIVNSKGEILVAGVSGIYRFDENAAASGSTVKFLGLNLALGGDADFERIDVKSDHFWMEPFVAALSPNEETFAVVSGDKIAILVKNDDDKWESKRRIDRDNTDPAIVGFAKSDVIVASQSGTIDVLDASSLERKAQYTPFRNNQPQLIRTSPDGRWVAVLFHHRKIWLFDAQTQEPANAGISGQGDITSVAFNRKNELYVADRFGRVIQYDSEHSFREVNRFNPELDWAESVYLWGLSPLHTVFPKPGEMDNLVTWLLTEQKTISIDNSDNLNAQRIVIDIWQPLWSNLAFLAVMLGFTCLIVARKDF